MGRPGTFVPQQHPGLPDCLHYDSGHIHDALVSAPGRVEARSLALPFGDAVIHMRGTTSLPAHWLRTLDNCLAGQRPDLAPGIARRLAESCAERPATIHPVGLDLLARMGIDIPSALLLAIICDTAMPGSVDGLQLVSADGSDQAWLDIPVAKDEDRHIRIMSASIAPNCFWSESGVTVDGIPETALAILPGRPLLDVVSHPALDQHQFVIDKVEEQFDMITLCIEAANPQAMMPTPIPLTQPRI